MKSKHTTKLITYFFYVLIVFFAAKYLVNIDYGSLRLNDINYSYLILASLLSISFRYWGVYIWLSLLKNLGAKNIKNHKQLAYVYAKAWMGRYIPGTVTWILGKIYFASEQGISKSKLAVSSIVEGAAQVGVLMLLSSIVLLFTGQLDLVAPQLKIAVGSITLLIAVFLTPRVFNFILRNAVKILKKDIDLNSIKVSRSTINKALILYSVGFILTGLSYHIFGAAITADINSSNILYSLGVFNFAGAVGIAAIFVPSGIGVREAVLVLLLTPVTGLDVAIIISVASRLWSLIVDLLFFSLTLFTYKFFNKS